MHTILIIEDDIISHIIFQRFLSDVFNITIVTTGYDAFEILKERTFDIIIVDYFLPDMTGEQISQQIKTLFPHTIVVCCSGNSDAKLSSSFDYFIEKPFSRKEIKELIKLLRS